METIETQRKPEITEEEDGWSITLSFGENGAKAGMKYSKNYFKTLKDVEENLPRIIQDYQNSGRPDKWS